MWPRHTLATQPGRGGKWGGLCACSGVRMAEINTRKSRWGVWLTVLYLLQIVHSKNTLFTLFLGCEDNCGCFLPSPSSPNFHNGDRSLSWISVLQGRVQIVQACAYGRVFRFYISFDCSICLFLVSSTVCFSSIIPQLGSVVIA